MPTTVKSLGIDRLSYEEQLALVQEIWDLLAANQESLLSKTQRHELERRIAEDDATPDNVVAWEAVKAQTIGRLQKP